MRRTEEQVQDYFGRGNADLIVAAIPRDEWVLGGMGPALFWAWRAAMRGGSGKGAEAWW
jgi:hypothetical protein